MVNVRAFRHIWGLKVIRNKPSLGESPEVPGGVQDDGDIWTINIKTPPGVGSTRCVLIRDQRIVASPLTLKSSHWNVYEGFSVQRGLLSERTAHRAEP